jgi:hypothetical protein
LRLSHTLPENVKLEDFAPTSTDPTHSPIPADQVAEDRPRMEYSPVTKLNRHREHHPIRPHDTLPKSKVQLGDTSGMMAVYEGLLLGISSLWIHRKIAQWWTRAIDEQKRTACSWKDESTPVWWPQEVRHKEPTHLSKPGVA